MDIKDSYFDKADDKGNKKSTSNNKSNNKSQSMERKSGALEGSSYYDAMMNNNAYALIEHPDESILEYELSDHNIPQFVMHTDFLEKQFNEPFDNKGFLSSAAYSDELADTVDDIIGESSLKEGTVAPDRKKSSESPLSEQFQIKQNSFDMIEDVNKKPINEMSAENKNLIFAGLGASNEKSKRQVRFVSFEE